MQINSTQYDPNFGKLIIDKHAATSMPDYIKKALNNNKHIKYFVDTLEKNGEDLLVSDCCDILINNIRLKSSKGCEFDRLYVAYPDFDTKKVFGRNFDGLLLTGNNFLDWMKKYKTFLKLLKILESQNLPKQDIKSKISAFNFLYRIDNKYDQLDYKFLPELRELREPTLFEKIKKWFN